MVSHERGDMVNRVVTSAEEATNIAESFLKKRRLVVQPVKAIKEDDTWLVQVDVGILTTSVAEIVIDANTGKIVRYNIPVRSA
jgi:uncharacterized membrane protein YkoI